MSGERCVYLYTQLLTFSPSLPIIIFYKNKIFRDIIMAYLKKRNVYKKKRVVPKRKYARKPTVRGVRKIVQSVISKQVEKKHDDINLAATDYNMGQVAGNAEAFYAGDITPYQIPGSNPNQHTGSEIQITSAYLQLQLRQQSAAVAPCKVKFYLFRCKGTNTETASALVGNLFLDNQFVGGGSGIIDANSQMNSDYMGNYTMLRKWTVYMKPDQFSGQQMPVTRSIGFKFKKPLKVRWYTQTAGAYSEGRLILVALSDCGNCSTATASTLTNIPVSAVNTGQLLNFNMRWYYTDM